MRPQDTRDKCAGSERTASGNGGGGSGEDNKKPETHDGKTTGEYDTTRLFFTTWFCGSTGHRYRPKHGWLVRRRSREGTKTTLITKMECTTPRQRGEPKQMVSLAKTRDDD
jgi:hypothetical protein